MDHPIVIVDYSPEWPGQFEALRHRIASVLGGLAARIEHVGSTAVPGLAAKPIIDLDVLLASANDLPAAIRSLASIGYEHQGDLGVPGREAFTTQTGSPQSWSHHLYVFTDSSGEFSRHLAFRDYLRGSPEDAQAYGELKRMLALRFNEDRIAYNEGKTRFVCEVLRQELSRSRE
jgi:GrpB-like predicted nucleotidyltransferase (UPF0157 family)